MTNVQQVLVRLNTDVMFRNSVQQKGILALEEYNLSPREVAIISKLDLSQWIEIAANGPITPGDAGGSVRGIRV